MAAPVRKIVAPHLREGEIGGVVGEPDEIREADGPEAFAVFVPFDAVAEGEAAGGPGGAVAANELDRARSLAVRVAFHERPVRQQVDGVTAVAEVSRTEADRSVARGVHDRPVGRARDEDGPPAVPDLDPRGVDEVVACLEPRIRIAAPFVDDGVRARPGPLEDAEPAVRARLRGDDVAAVEKVGQAGRPRGGRGEKKGGEEGGGDAFHGRPGLDSRGGRRKIRISSGARSSDSDLPPGRSTTIECGFAQSRFIT